MAFDLLSQFDSGLGGGGQSNMGGAPAPPSTLEALVALIMPYLQSVQGQRTAGMDSLVRGLQTLRGGGVRDSLTGAIRNPNPLVAQQEHDTYWNNMFTSPAEAIAKERARFDPMGLRPEQKTFTEQGIERMNQSPQQRVNAAMGPGWEGMSPAQRRVQLQQMHGQVPDFQDPLGGASIAASPQGPPALSPLDEVLAATMGGTPSPTPMARGAAPAAPMGPLSTAPSPAGPPQASMVSPAFNINDLLKAGPPIHVATGQNTQGYRTNPPGPAVPSNPWMYGVGTNRAPMDFTPNLPPLPNFQSTAFQPWRYGTGTLGQ